MADGLKRAFAATKKSRVSPKKTLDEARAVIIHLREALYNAPYEHAPHTKTLAALTAAEDWLKANP